MRCLLWIPLVGFSLIAGAQPRFSGVKSWSGTIKLTIAEADELMGTTVSLQCEGAVTLVCAQAPPDTNLQWPAPLPAAASVAPTGGDMREPQNALKAAEEKLMNWNVKTTYTKNVELNEEGNTASYHCQYSGAYKAKAALKIQSEQFVLSLAAAPPAEAVTCTGTSMGKPVDPKLSGYYDVSVSYNTSLPTGNQLIGSDSWIEGNKTVSLEWNLNPAP